MAKRLDQNLGSRRLLLLGIVAAGVLALVQLGIAPGDLIPSDASGAGVGKFFLAALTPAIGADTLLIAARAALTTLRFAALATAISVVGGFVLGFLGSTAWWPTRSTTQPSASRRPSCDACTHHLHALGSRAALGHPVPHRDRL